MIYLMLGLVGIAIIILVIGVIEIKRAGRCCGDCKLRYKCWSHIDKFTYEQPACENFVEEDYNEK